MPRASAMVRMSAAPDPAYRPTRDRPAATPEARFTGREAGRAQAAWNGSWNEGPRNSSANQCMSALFAGLFVQVAAIRRGRVPLVMRCWPHSFCVCCLTTLEATSLLPPCMCVSDHHN